MSYCKGPTGGEVSVLKNRVSESQNRHKFGRPEPEADVDWQVNYSSHSVCFIFYISAGTNTLTCE